MFQASKINKKKQKYINFKYYKNLSALVGGIRSGELITIGARVGCGKTTLALNLACDLIEQDIKCLFCSCEMNKNDLMDKIEKSYSFDNECLDKLYIEDDRNKITTYWIESMIKKHKFKVVFIDYVQIMNANIRIATRELKHIANKYGVVIICLAQLNRQAEGKEPQLSMLKDSGTIEQDSDEVWFIKQWELKVAKNRKGRIGKIDIVFYKDISCIKESTYHSDLVYNVAKSCIDMLKDDDLKQVGIYMLNQKLAKLDFVLYQDIMQKYLYFQKEKTREAKKNAKSTGSVFTYVLNI